MITEKYHHHECSNGSCLALKKHCLICDMQVSSNLITIVVSPPQTENTKSWITYVEMTRITTTSGRVVSLAAVICGGLPGHTYCTKRPCLQVQVASQCSLSSAAREERRTTTKWRGIFPLYYLQYRCASTQYAYRCLFGYYSSYTVACRGRARCQVVDVEYINAAGAAHMAYLVRWAAGMDAFGGGGRTRLRAPVVATYS
jgi:hypothetical protein